MRTFQEVQKALQELAHTDIDVYAALRRRASADLQDELHAWLGSDHGHGISSSDVSCHLIEMVQFGDIDIPQLFG